MEHQLHWGLYKKIINMKFYLKAFKIFHTNVKRKKEKKYKAHLYYAKTFQNNLAKFILIFILLFVTWKNTFFQGN